jgi:hypothetical protein
LWQKREDSLFSLGNIGIMNKNFDDVGIPFLLVAKQILHVQCPLGGAKRRGRSSSKSVQRIGEELEVSRGVLDMNS